MPSSTLILQISTIHRTMVEIYNLWDDVGIVPYVWSASFLRVLTAKRS